MTMRRILPTRYGEMERFSRIQSFLGEEGFKILQQSFITIVGIGAVGGHVTEGLARAGINRLRLVDFDTVQPSNINRQIMALDTTLGRPKVEVARERIAAINPGARWRPCSCLPAMKAWNRS